MEEKLTVKVGANLSEFERKMGQLQSKMDSLGKSMQNMGAGMFKGITLPVAAAVAASVKSFADLEQAQGGIETMFKNSADAVIANSETAYKRAGVSGVQYMENVTSFSATLLQGLEGDTEKAAKAADTAMVDMSDNANKFGTDIGSIQDAYQGFAKDNYTMLDNLKLGYGGTAGEMARLINESGVLGDTMEVTAETVKDVPFHTMIEAIHEVQTEMGVTGTTVKEAEETVSGSFGMMKASFQDLAAGFGQEGANIEGLFSNLWSSVGSFADNIKRVLGTIWDNLPLAGWQKWLGLITVAMGPVLFAVGKFISFIAGIATALAPVMASIAKAGGLLKWLAPVFAALTSPITLTIAGIAALGTAFVIAYNKSETFRNFVNGIKDKFMNAIEWIGNFKDGIIGLFQDDGMAGVDILTSIGISQEMADKLWEFTGHFIEFYHNVKEQIDKVKTAFKGIFDIFTGNTITGVQLLQSIGLSEETIENILLFVGKIKAAFFEMRYRIAEALTGVKDFFVEQFEGVRAWWDSDGAMIFDAMGIVVQKVFDGIKFAIDFALKFVIELFNTFAPIVMGIWNVLWPTLKAVASATWEQIKLVIGIAMDLIQGIISGIAALITGDWSRFGEILKETALSIWNRVTEYFGAMKENALTLFSELFSGAGTWFSNLWTTIVEKVTSIKDNVVTKFTELKDGAINRITGMYNSVVTWFQNLWTNITNKAMNLKDTVVQRFTELKDNVVSRIVGMYGSVTGWFSNLWSNVTSKVEELKNSVVTKFTNMKDNAVAGVKALFDGASEWFQETKEKAVETFNNMVEGAKELPGRIGEAIKNMAHKAVEGITSLGKSMGDKLESVVNGVIGGLNKVLSAIGVDEIGTISINTGGGAATTGAAGALRRFSTGTRNGAIAEDMLGIVNDIGPGNGQGGATQELIQRGGQLFAPRGKNAIVRLEKGDRIYNGAQTQSLMSSGIIPRFSRGTGSEGGNTGESKGLLGTLKDVSENVWDYITNPGKAFDAIINAVTPDFSGMAGFAGDFLKGGFIYLTNGVKDFITKVFKENEGGLGSGKGAHFMSFPMTTPYSPNSAVPGYPTSFNGGRHYGIDYGTPIGTPVHATTSGTVSKLHNMGGGLVAKLKTGKLTQFFMHLADIVKTGSVKAGDLIAKTGNSGKWTTGPHIHWQAQQGSDIMNQNTVDPRKVVGHANGGIFRNRHIAQINEEGPEAVIPLNARRRSRANTLYDSVGKAIGRNDGQQFSEMISNQQTQINQMNEAIGILFGIEDKTGFDPAKAQKSINKHNNRRTIMT